AANLMLQRRKAVGSTLVSFAGLASSRDFKKDITALDENEAIFALAALTPVLFTYKDSNESHVGFIAEDVPDLVAMPGRKSLHPMDFVGVLTKVVQAQQKTIERLTSRIEAIEGTSR